MRLANGTLVEGDLFDLELLAIAMSDRDELRAALAESGRTYKVGAEIRSHPIANQLRETERQVVRLSGRLDRAAAKIEAPEVWRDRTDPFAACRDPAERAWCEAEARRRCAIDPKYYFIDDSDVRGLIAEYRAHK